MTPPSLTAPAPATLDALAPPRQADERAAGDAAVELVRLVSRLQEENRFLAGQVGFLQAQLDQLRDGQEQLPPPAWASGASHRPAALPAGSTLPSEASAPLPSNHAGADASGIPPGQVTVDADELALLRQARVEYEAEMERMAEEIARMQDLLTELESESGDVSEILEPLAPPAPPAAEGVPDRLAAGSLVAAAGSLQPPPGGATSVHEASGAGTYAASLRADIDGYAGSGTAANSSPAKRPWWRIW